MNIAFIADDGKKESMVQLCIAYKEILKNHNLFGTGPTANVIMKNTGLTVQKFLSAYDGGDVQIASRVSYDEIDIVFFLIDHEDPSASNLDTSILLRQCDINNVPIATNIASAEILIHGIEHGDFEWREILREKKKKS